MVAMCAHWWDFIGKKKDAPVPDHELDVEATLNKYLMEEKTETFFDWFLTDVWLILDW